jgi:ATP-dependent exoDNAse (exonuclease V) alpha subunit
VRLNPATYPHLEYGWATTTHKSQGRGDPLVIPTLGKNDWKRHD